MIQKYVFGTPFETEAVTARIPETPGRPAYGKIGTEGGFSFEMPLGKEDIVYGLEKMSGGSINGGISISAMPATILITRRIRVLFTRRTTS